MKMNARLAGWRTHWKLIAVVGAMLILVSLALLVLTLTPAGEALRVQATLAPIPLVPPGGAP